MNDSAQGKALHLMNSPGLARHPETLEGREAEEIEPVSLDQDRRSGRTKRILLITDPEGTPSALLGWLFHGRGNKVDVMAVYNQGDLEKVHDRLTAKAYDLLIPSNMGLSPWYIPALVSHARDLYPALKIMVISGWSSPDFVQDLHIRGIHDFVHVPMQEEDLQRRARRLLTACSGPRSS
jgi:DNA-binding NtrC family response regulator